MSVPDGIDLGRHLRLDGHGQGAHLKGALLVLLAAIPVLALANVFGQHPETSTTRTGAATLQLVAPASLRSGLLTTTRITIVALREIRRATLELGRGWTEGMQVNTVEPTPLAEASHGGRLRLVLGHVPRGDRYVLWIALQVNPSTLGRHAQDVRLLDGERELAVVRRTLTVFP